MNKFLNNPGDRPLHSSGLARVAHGGSMGSTSSQSFGQRTRIDANRRSIQRYSDSMVARYGATVDDVRPKIDIVNPARGSRRPVGRPTGFRGSANGTTSPQSPAGGVQSPQPTPRFVEPPTRGYNPYA